MSNQVEWTVSELKCTDICIEQGRQVRKRKLLHSGREDWEGAKQAKARAREQANKACADVLGRQRLPPLHRAFEFIITFVICFHLV